jgi:hypothetical protein
MRLLQSVLSRLKPTKKPQRKFVAHLLGLLLLLPGHTTLRNMSRYSPYHERTLARWYDTPFDWVSFNKVAITAVVPSEHEQAFGSDASFVPKSGKQTSGLARFWNGSHSRTEKGLDISTLAWLDLTGNCAYCLRVEQTPPRPAASDSAATRMDVSLDQLRRVVEAHAWRFLRYVLTDGAYSHQKFVAGGVDLGMHHIGQLRADAHVRYLSQGPKRPGRGRHKTYDGKVYCRDLSRCERLDTEDDHIVLYHQGLNHVQRKGNLQVVIVVNTQRNRYAVLFSTDMDLEPLRLARAYKARFHMEFIFRDAKQCTGLSHCQARSKAKLDFHCNASLSAVNSAKLQARQQQGDSEKPMSMASLKRRAFNQHLLDRIVEH